MRRALRWTFISLSALCWGLAVLMALLEVVHLAHGQSEHFAALFAAQALVLAAVFTVSAIVAARSDESA